MALYEVSRTDQPGPGEFVTAHVIAGGASLARKAVAHMGGVESNGSNVSARRVDTAAPKTDPVVLSAYFDESPPLPFGDAEDATGHWKS